MKIRKPQFDSKFSRIWYEHVGQLVRLGWDMEPEELERLHAIVDELKRMVDRVDSGKEE